MCLELRWVRRTSTARIAVLLQCVVAVSKPGGRRIVIVNYQFNCDSLFLGGRCNDLLVAAMTTPRPACGAFCFKTYLVLLW